MQPLPKLLNHAIAAVGQPLPPLALGIQWILAANGVFKRAANSALEVCIQVHSWQAPIPGLVNLLPVIRWKHHPQRLPKSWLDILLQEARKACEQESGITIPQEKQWFVVWRDSRIRLIAPAAQVGTPTQVRYAMPQEPVLLDIHSHHHMHAYFSATDDRDDDGLSVSMVIGKIFDQYPEAVARVNVYGDRQIIPLSLLFEGGSDSKEQRHVEITRSD